MSKASARISFVTPQEKRRRLDEIAAAYGKNLSSVLNEAVDQYIALQEWQFNHIEKGVQAAKSGDFVSEKDVEAFFQQYGE